MNACWLTNNDSTMAALVDVLRSACGVFQWMEWSASSQQNTAHDARKWWSKFVAEPSATHGYVRICHWHRNLPRAIVLVL